jgi:tRNA pseudouridine38-40 synthase
MAFYKLFIEYEGTRFSGWQIQNNARTIQGEIQQALSAVIGKNSFEFGGSGRTDAGVHALEQVAHLSADTVLAPEILRFKLNDLLPADINILEIVKLPKRFDSRREAVARSYLYQISRRRTAFGKRFVWWIKDHLDIRRMQEAATLFPGLKDFRSFTADDPEEKSTRVLIDDVVVEESGDLILIRITGSHFLWKMVRQMAGILAEAGRGNMTTDEIRKFISEASDVPARFTAPPSGLFLARVYYPGDPRDEQAIPLMRIAGGGKRKGR